MNKLLQSNTVKKVASNTMFQIIGKVVSMSITILATVIITRSYGRVGFGEFNLMQNIPALFFIIVDFGFNAIATREISKNPELAKKYLGNILIVRFALSMLMMALVAIALQFFPYSDALRLGIYLGLFIIVTQALYTTTNIIFQVHLRYDLSTIGYIIGSFVTLGFVLFFTSIGSQIMWVNFSYILGGIITFLINIYFVSRFVDLSNIVVIDKKVIKYLFIQSLPLGLMFVFSQVNFKADSIMLSVFESPDWLNLSSTEVVAIYGLPYKIFEVLLVVPTFLMNATFPIFVRHLEESKERFVQTFFRTTLVLFVLGVFVSICTYIFAPLGISLLGGSEFNQSVDALRLLSVGFPILYITSPIAWLIVTLEGQRFLPFIYFIGALFNFSANLYFIPQYSFYASGALTWLSELLILILLGFFAKKVWNDKYAKKQVLSWNADDL